MDQTSSQDTFSRICVFCGSSSGNKAIYTEVAQQLGVEMVKRNIDLVYGGGSIGLMGTVAKTVQDNGVHVVGVIPRALMPKEICGATFGDLVAVDDMHQRKAEMARRADAFIALPGGFGTFEEVLEIITWAQLGILTKPVGLLNVDGYYDAMLALFDKAFEEGFLNLASRNIVVSAPTAHALVDGLKNYAPIIDKSVPQLIWDTITGVSTSSKPKVNGATAFHNRGFSMEFQGAQTAMTKCRITKMKLGALHHYPVQVQQGSKSGLSRSQPMAKKLSCIAHRPMMAFL